MVARRGVKLLLTCLLVWMGYVPQVVYSEDHLLFQGVRAMGMGNAFTAIADDEQAIFYNPAGLAGIRKVSFNLASVGLDASSDILSSYSTLAGSIKNFGPGSLNDLMGKNLYARAQAYSTIIGPSFGLAAIADQQLAFRLHNQVSPEIDFAGQTTYGVQAAFGFTIVKFKKKKGEIRLGFAGKMMWRGGGYQKPSLSDLLNLNLQSVVNTLTHTGVGYGADAGLQIIYNLKKNLKVLAGLAYTDMGDTSFAAGSDPQKGNLTGGLGIQFRSQDMIATLAYDYAHLFDYADWRLKTHLGLELKFPILTLSVGLNQLYPTYGAAIDLWLIKVQYVSYAQELSSTFGVNPERRNMLQATFKLDF